MAQLRLLSVRQPWASFLVHGIKQLEVRSWKTDYRGPVAIRASGRLNRALLEWLASDDLLWKSYLRLPHPDVEFEDFEQDVRATLPTGGVVGFVTLSDCRPMSEWAKQRWNKTEQLASFGNRKKQPANLYGFRVTNPIPVKGRLVDAPGLLNLVKWSSRNPQVERYCKAAKKLLG